jgi:poly-gamma-glutamate synthesis protein (capsule biosynthesis protein)
MDKKIFFGLILVLVIIIGGIFMKDSLKRALGIPYPWGTTLTWLFFHAKPSISNPPKDFNPIGPGTLDIGKINPGSARIVFLGDIMPITSDTKLVIDSKIKEIISGASAVVLNLEAPLGPVTKVSGTRFQMSVNEFKRILEELGIDPKKAIVSVANNHSEDYGVEGLKQTIDILNDLGCRVIGMHEDSNSKPIFETNIDNINIGFAGWTQWRNRPTNSNDFRPYVTDDITSISQQEILKMNLDMVVGFPHWDLEFRHMPQTTTKEFAKELVEKGFGLIVGHHPHVIQGAEKINESLVFYSAGNAISNEFCARPWAGQIGQIIVIDIEKQSQGTIIKNYRVDPFIIERSKQSVNIKRFESTEVAPKFKDRFDFVFPAQL